MDVDVEFSGNQDATEALNDRYKGMLRHRYIISQVGRPILWKSQLQTEISLSSTESEYTGLSHSLREAIPIMESINDMKKHNFPIYDKTLRVRCKVFEDNSGAIEISMTHRYHPVTKHLNNKLYHFRDYVTTK